MLRCYRNQLTDLSYWLVWMIRKSEAFITFLEHSRMTRKRFGLGSFLVRPGTKMFVWITMFWVTTLTKFAWTEHHCYLGTQEKNNTGESFSENKEKVFNILNVKTNVTVLSPYKISSRLRLNQTFSTERTCLTATVKMKEKRCFP